MNKEYDILELKKCVKNTYKDMEFPLTVGLCYAVGLDDAPLYHVFKTDDGTPLDIDNSKMRLFVRL